MKNYLFAIIILLIGSPLLGQDFGEISDQELSMDQCLEEPESDVVILFDKCFLRITGDFNLEVKYHKRIKILTEKGKEYANIKINYWYEDIVNRIDAICVSPNGEEYELDSDNIFEEEGDKFNTKSFAIPGVEVGSVIEFEYRLWSEYITRLEPWVFQDKNFTKLSQLQILVPKGFTYNKVSLNTNLYDFEEKIDEVMNPESPSKRISQFTWIGRNINGLKKEPYIDNLEDKYAKIIFSLHSYKDFYRNINFAKTWNDVAVRTSKKYNDLIEQDGGLEKKAKEIVGSETDDLTKTKMIYDYIKKEIKLGNHTSIFGSEFKEPEKVLKSKIGSSSEKNMLLINMLTHIGFNAKPILISTRKNGEIIKDFTDRSQFNRLICRLIINKKNYFLNCGFRANPYGYLTPATDVELGLLIDNENGRIVSIKPLKSINKTEYISNYILAENGTIEASTKISYKGYSALIERNSIEDEIDSEVKDKIESLIKKVYAGAKLDSFFYSNKEIYDKPLLLNINYSIPDYIDESGELIYFELPFFTSIDENPFKRNNRFYSIDFKYKEFISEKIVLNFSNNLSLIEAPSDRRYKIKNYSYIKKLKYGQDFIKCTKVNNLKARQISHIKYKYLKSLFENIIATEQEQVVLKKNTIQESANESKGNQ